MKLTYRGLALLTAFAFLLSSCAGPGRSGEGSRWSSPGACIAAHTAGGAALGALTGVLVATATGKRGKVGQGAVIGSLAGGALAFAYAWGSCFAAFTKVTSTPREGFGNARTRIGYKPSQGTVVQIRNSSLEPSAIAPGEKPKMHADYLVMTPKQTDVTVTETVALKVYNPNKRVFEEVGETSETIVVSPGERRASSEIPIPPNAENGKFFILFKVAVQGHRVEQEMPLTITNDEIILAAARNDLASRQSRRDSDAPPASAQEPTVLAEVGSKTAAPATSLSIMITAKKANIRESPNLKSNILVKASAGSRFRVVKSMTIDGKQWHHIQLASGKLAWITASTCKLVE